MSPPFVDPLLARRALIIAPHPDDETLGCGGVISILAEAGADLHIVFVTDGSASHRNSPTWPRPRLAELREAEATQALVELGAGTSDRTFMHLPDAAMPKEGGSDWEVARSVLSKIAATLQPDVAILPWRRDPHCDHRDSWRLATLAMADAGVRPLVLEYAIWLAELGHASDFPLAGEVDEVRVDIGDAVRAKRSAIIAHRSQTTDLISDDPTGFRLRPETLDRLIGPRETFWHRRP